MVKTVSRNVSPIFYYMIIFFGLLALVGSVGLYMTGRRNDIYYVIYSVFITTILIVYSGYKLYQ